MHQVGVAQGSACTPFSGPLTMLFRLRAAARDQWNPFKAVSDACKCHRSRAVDYPHSATSTTMAVLITLEMNIFHMFVTVSAGRSRHKMAPLPSTSEHDTFFLLVALLN